MEENNIIRNTAVFPVANYKVYGIIIRSVMEMAIRKLRKRGYICVEVGMNKDYPKYAIITNERREMDIQATRFGHIVISGIDMKPSDGERDRELISKILTLYIYTEKNFVSMVRMQRFMLIYFVVVAGIYWFVCLSKGNEVDWLKIFFISIPFLINTFTRWLTLKIPMYDINKGL